MSLYLYLDAVTNLYILKHKGFVFNPKAGSLMLIEREEDGFVNLQALYDNKAFRQNTNGHILNDFIDPETVVNELGVSYGNDAQAIRTALADFFVDAPSGGGGLSVEQVKSQSTTKAPSSKLFADVTGDLELGFKSSIASLENVINSANINQELTATATGVDTVALTKTAANTGMQVQMFGQSAQNLVVNGDFRNGTTGWSATDSGAVISASNNILTHTVAATAFEGIGIRRSATFLANNKYYLSADIKTNNNSSGTFFYGLDSTAAGYVIGIAGINDSFVKLSGIVTAPIDRSAIILGQRSARVGVILQYKNVQAINLTATFGAGNEPTKEQCDVLFANYFEGSDNVLGTGRVRSVGNNLIKPTYIQGFQVSTTDGTFVAGATFSRSDYFRVAASTAYILSSNTNTGTDHRIAFYDLNKVFISGATQTSGQPISVTSPATAYYAIVSSLTTKVDTFRLTRGTSSFESYRESILQLTTPELRSNGTTKDEIRKGTNGYELVKRVGVGTLGSELITNAADREFSSDTGWWTKSGWTISGGTANANGSSTNLGIRKLNALTVGKIYKVKWDIVNFVNGNIWLYAGLGVVHPSIGGTPMNGLDGKSWTNAGTFEVYIIATSTNIGFGSYGVSNLSIDNVSWIEVIPVETGGDVKYNLLTPTISQIAHAGLLNSNSNGTVYFEPIIADAGVYSTNLTVQLTDYPINAFESIRKYANGTYTELNTATAVIASGGLSFTHPDLVSGDLVMFTYAYNRESIGRSMTLTHYDSRFVEADTVNGKVYRIVPVVTNGVVSWTAVEV